MTNLVVTLRHTIPNEWLVLWGTKKLKADINSSLLSLVYLAHAASH